MKCHCFNKSVILKGVTVILTSHDKQNYLISFKTATVPTIFLSKDTYEFSQANHRSAQKRNSFK